MRVRTKFNPVRQKQYGSRYRQDTFADSVGQNFGAVARNKTVQVVFFVFLGLLGFYIYIRKTAKKEFLAIAPPDVPVDSGSTYTQGEVVEIVEEAYKALYDFGWYPSVFERENIMFKMYVVQNNQLIAIYNQFKNMYYKKTGKTLTALLADLTVVTPALLGSTRDGLVSRLRKLKCL